MPGRIERAEIISEEALKVFDNLFNDLVRVIGKAEELKAALKGATSLNDVADAVKKTSENTKKLTDTEKELARQTKALAKEKAKLANIYHKNNKALIQTQEKTRAATRAMREQAREQLNLTKSGGGLTGMFKNLIKSAGGYLLAMVAVQRVIQFFTRDLLNLTKKLDSLHFSMRTIIKDQEEYAATNIFLAKTAINYGLDILTLTERYIKFRAAAQQSNLSARETMRIFDSTAKAAAVLGLKTDEVNGVFLALEQMISKGKVTTEELRRQLGERLPGAMGIMADAVGVSISELDKMLKKGEVLSSEALPKFAIALEKAYGIEAVNKVNTLAAAQGRLTTSWVQFVDQLQASKAYIGIINELGDALNTIAFTFQNPSLRKDTEQFFNMLEKGFDKTGKAFVELIDEMTNAEKQGLPKTKEFFIEFVDSIGFSLKEAEILYEEYLRRVNLFTEEQSKAKVKPFNIDQYKKDLDQAATDFEDFNKIRTDDLKQSAADNSKAIDDENKTFKQFILNQIDLLKTAEKVAKSKHIVEQGMADLAKRRGVLRTKEELQQLEDSFTNFQNTTLARIELETRLFDLQNKKGGTDDTLAIEKANNKKRLAMLEEMFKFGEDSKTTELKKEVELLKIKKQLNDRLTQFTKAGSKERAQIEAESQVIQTDIAQKNAEVRMNIDEEWVEGNLELMEGWKNERIAQIFELANEERVEVAKRINREFLATNRSAKDRINSKWKETVELLTIEHNALQEILEDSRLTADERAKFEEDLARLRETLAQKGVDFEKKANDQRLKDIRDVAEVAREVLNSGFAFNQALNDRATENAQRRFDLETALAGENKFKQLNAEKKFEREMAKIKRREAIANKAAAAAQIIINTAVAISSATTSGPLGLFLIPLLAGIGALQLATVLATPIPQFAAGTTDAPHTFIAGEEGVEAITKPSGQTFLTPNKPTLFSDKSLAGSTILPHDETQRMLAQQAYSQTYDMVDMSQTNNHLSRIDKNTSKSIDIVDGKKIVRKRGFVGTYKI